ncbi:hypothetical protein YIM1640_14630 [Thermus oshimai]
MNVKLFPRVVDALHGADLLAAPVLYADAGLADHVRHPQPSKPHLAPPRGRGAMTGVKGKGGRLRGPPSGLRLRAFL